MPLHVHKAWAVAALAAMIIYPAAAGASSVALKPTVCGVAANARLVAPWDPEVPQFLAVRNPNGPYGKASVAVTLDDRGNVVGTGVYESSGSALLDREALKSARLSRYAPEENQCSARSGSYVVVVDFD